MATLFSSSIVFLIPSPKANSIFLTAPINFLKPAGSTDEEYQNSQELLG